MKHKSRIPEMCKNHIHILTYWVSKISIGALQMEPRKDMISLQDKVGFCRKGMTNETMMGAMNIRKSLSHLHA